MTDHALRRNEAAALLDAVNESMWKATDHARYPTAALVALTQAVLEVGEQLRIANRLTIAIATKNPIEITPETAATLGIAPQE
jgi:hypothetical protein